MRLIDTDKLKFPNIAIFQMKLHGVTVPMVRLLDLKELMPTVDVAHVVHGQWLSLNSDNGEFVPVPWDEMNEGCPEGSCFCSVCTDWLTGSDEYPAKGIYCPNCGAKMDLNKQKE